MTTVSSFGQSYRVEHQLMQYRDGNLAVTIICDDGAFGTLSTNVDGVELAENEFCVKTWSENAPWALDFLNKNQDVFEDTGRTFASGFVTGPIYRVK
jgi:hypothetical protein